MPVDNDSLVSVFEEGFNPDISCASKSIAVKLVDKKALAKSRTTTSVWILLSRFRVSSSVNSISWDSQE